MAQYTAPGRDGTYIDDPGRENPTYNETDSLMIMNEMENNDHDDDNPYRPPPDDDDDPHDPKGQSPLLSRDKGKDPDAGRSSAGGSSSGDGSDGSDNSDDSDDLFFEEDREALKKDKILVVMMDQISKIPPNFETKTTTVVVSGSIQRQI